MNPIRLAVILFTFAFCSTLAAAPSAPPWTSWDAAMQGRFITAAAFGNGRAYVGTEDKGLWMLDTVGPQWVKCNPPEVLDDSVRSLAVDGQGRLWAGYAYHGVSVFNGKTWKTFDAPDGPLGHHVFKIVISPVDGDVWLATDVGLTRYSVATDKWSHITQADGLPSDQISCLAFAKDGTLYVGTQCDGIAIATPADSYAIWQTTTGPDRASLDVSGTGLPSSLINDLVLDADGSVFAGTASGLAVSDDRGKTWSFYRGQDFADKVDDRTGGPPVEWNPPVEVPLLPEDYISTLAVDSAGRLWVGHREVAADLLDCKTRKKIDRGLTDGLSDPAFVKSFLPDGRGNIWVGTYGSGLHECPCTAADHPSKPDPTDTTPQLEEPPLPSVASVPPQLFDALQHKLSAVKPVDLKAAFLGDDWVTRGDGVGRYGMQKQCMPHYGTGGWVSVCGACGPP